MTELLGWGGGGGRAPTLQQHLNLLCSPGRLGCCNTRPLVSLAVGVRVEKHVALQTQPLDTRGALSVNRGNPTDAAGLCRHKQQPVKRQQKQTLGGTPVSEF